MKEERPQSNSVRSSNFELLRIVSMFFVLIVHANFLSLGVPTSTDIATSPIISFFRFFIQSLSIVCVNVFILISGWFSIKPNKKKIIGFIFQVFFFITIGVFFELYKIGFDGIHPRVWFHEFKMAINSEGYWFVSSYIILYLFAPILNAFAVHCEKRQFAIILLGIFIFQFISSNGYFIDYFNYGYSPISFMCLYLLARFLRIYGGRFHGATFFFLVYITCSITLALINLKYGFRNEYFYYNYPLVIISSLALLLLFSWFSFTSRGVNNIAKSSFAVYLLHCHPAFFRIYYTPFFKESFISNPYGRNLIICFIAVTCVFFISIIIDQIRIILWQLIIHLVKRCNCYIMKTRWFQKQE